ncbi:MAG: tetratricopeptide repeat protein [Balneolaceae bacterium]
MANQPNDHLFQLIKSLSKAEKRSFKIYALRNSSDDAKFVQLFDAVDKAKDYDEEIIITKITDLKKSQLSNLKAHLYKQILTSLRLNYINHNVDIQIREQIDHARILYDKGLYKQSLKILEKAKALSYQHHRITLTAEILGFEKLIESQYITRSLRNRADQLIEETEESVRSVERYHALSNLSLRLYGIYIKAGHVRSEKDFDITEKYFERALSNIDLNGIGFFEKHYLNVSYAWYSLIVQDFLMQYRYAQKWVEHFRNNPDMLELESIWYLKGMHVLLEALFILGHYEKHEQEVQNLKNFLENPPTRSNENLKTLGIQYYYTSLINQHFITGTFSEGLQVVPELNEVISSLEHKIDPHRILVFYYKIACLYFGAGKFEEAITYLNKIINYPDPRLREDIHCFARILNLIAHFELGNQTLLEYQVRSTYRFIIKMNDLNSVQEEILKFLRNLTSTNPLELRIKFIELREKLIEIQKKPYQRRAFLYLDIISWLESKIDDKPIQEVIKAKFKPRNGH